MVVTKRNPSLVLSRVCSHYEGDRAWYPEDFDEDLSDLEEKSEKAKAESTPDCECDGEDSECECQIKDDEDVYDSDDSMSDRSIRWSVQRTTTSSKDEREERSGNCET